MKSALVDTFGRTIEYLRVSVTDLCNLRCIYCIPPAGVERIGHDEILRYEEILAVIDVAQEMGIRKIRITGGEPLVRRGVVGFVESLARLQGVQDVGLTTNGVRLAELARALRDAGLRRVNVSLDSLNRETFKRITGSDRLQEVISGITAALDAGLNPVKINVVLLRGLNEQDVPAFARLTMDLPVDVRFIERMPFGGGGVPNPPDAFSGAKALELVRRRLGEPEPAERSPLDGPAAMFRLNRAAGRIGIIDPITGHFCGTCNRMRLTARGTLRPCLLSKDEIDVKTELRNGASREALARILRSAVSEKPLGNCMSSVLPRDAMNLIGG